MKRLTNGVCLALGVETQAFRSTGFHELRESILGLDESKMAYCTIFVDIPYTRCMYVAGLTYWAEKVNKGLLDYLEKISKGECVRVLNVDYSKYSSKDYWLRSRMKDDMTAYSDMPLSLVTGQSEYSSSLDLYNGYETIVCEMVVNFKKVESTFDHPQLYDPLMQQLKRQYADPLIDYEYAKMKERYIEPTLKDYLKMQVAACVEFLHSGMLSEALSICNEDIDKVDKEKILKMLDPRCKVPANLKELWAKFMKLMVYEEDVLLVPKRDKIRIQVLKHFDDLNEDQFRALFRLDDRLRLIHQDMIKLKPELAHYLNKREETNTFGIVNSLTRLMQQAWFKDSRTDKKYDDAWIEKFVSALLASEHRQTLLDTWQVTKKRQNLKSNIIGCLKMAGVIDGSDLGIATALLNGTKKENTNFANYMGRGKKMAFCDWICDYVKH